MSENSLKIRNKFVNRVVNKLNVLKDDLELLYKVDKKISRKIFKNTNNQTGGNGIEEASDNVKRTQLTISKKQLELQKIHDDRIKEARNHTKDLSAIIDNFTNMIEDLTIQIQNMDLNKTPQQDEDAVVKLIRWDTEQLRKAQSIYNSGEKFNTNNNDHQILFKTKKQFDFVNTPVTPRVFVPPRGPVVPKDSVPPRGPVVPKDSVPSRGPEVPKVSVPPRGPEVPKVPKDLSKF